LGVLSLKSCIYQSGKNWCEGGRRLIFFFLGGLIYTVCINECWSVIEFLTWLSSWLSIITYRSSYWLFFKNLKIKLITITWYLLNFKNIITIFDGHVLQYINTHINIIYPGCTLYTSTTLTHLYYNRRVL
jgi:hypothetical protein